MKPTLHIIAGPNGAGKTTFANQFLPTYTNCREFVNADEIAKQLSPTNPETVAIRAGREMLKRIRILAEQKSDFAIETTLAGKSYLPWLRQLKEHGYEIHLCFLWLPEVEMSIKRVADRVRKGGHHIPKAIIRRRYNAGIKNLFSHYRSVLDSWTLFDNSHPIAYKIAREYKGNLTVLDRYLFQKFTSMSAESSNEQLQETHKLFDYDPALHALHLAAAKVIEEHLKTGHPLISWRDGKIYLQPPEEAKRELDAVLKNYPSSPVS